MDQTCDSMQAADARAPTAPDGARVGVEQRVTDETNDKTTLRDLRVSPVHELETGQILAGRYRILGPVGAGGMGAVYEAEQIELRRRVAIKLVIGSESDSFERLQREALGASAVQSPHVVTVFDFHWNEGEPPFLVMELLTGRSLEELLETDGALPWDRAARLACQILDGLAAAHRVGLVHRDVKPANVWLVPTMTGDLVKLLDFGLVKRLDEGVGITARSGRLMGTRAYLAPEQIHRLPSDPRSDLHAVGVVLWEMIAGRRIWQSRGPDVFAEIATRTPEHLTTIVSDVPRGLADAVARALAKDPEGRFRDAESMYAAIAPYASGTSALPPAPEEAPATLGIDDDVPAPPRTLGLDDDEPAPPRTVLLPQTDAAPHTVRVDTSSRPDTPKMPNAPSRSGAYEVGWTSPSGSAPLPTTSNPHAAPWAPPPPPPTSHPQLASTPRLSAPTVPPQPAPDLAGSRGPIVLALLLAFLALVTAGVVLAVLLRR